MRPLREISDRQIILIALGLWALIAIGSLITNEMEFMWSALIAIALGGYGLRIMRLRQQGNASEPNKSNEQ
jgi:hypothetical protein